MVKAKRFLDLVTRKEALELLKTRFAHTASVKMVPVAECAGYITAESIFARYSYPAQHLSAMDGIAVKSSDTIGATEQKPLKITDARRVNTGNLIPELYDAVIMIEDVEEDGDGWVIRSSAHPWQHIRPVGEDIAATEMILPSHHQIRTQEIGALIAYGITHVPVFWVKVALIPTGSEIIPIGQKPLPGQVIESNLYMAASLIKSYGGEVTHYPIVADDPDLIEDTITDALKDHQIILVSAGSSKGTKDYTARVIDRLGKVFVHGVAIKPAKPVIFGEIESKPVIGLPGYPIASYTILREFITPLLSWYGLSAPQPHIIQANLSSSLHSEIGTDEFVLVTVGKINDKWVASPLSRGSGVQMSMVRSNGYLTIDESSEGFEAGDKVQVTLTVNTEEAKEAVLITGSHDPVIDHLANLVRPSISITSSHVGSMGGILTLRKGYCHLAPTHLLADDGEYNIPYLRKYLSNLDVVLITVAEREQGVISREGLTFSDIQNYRYINRQRGSGTRMLLDHLLGKRRISPDTITGYQNEATTHLGVCLAIQNNEADLGMGIYSAAKAFDLSFVPVATERYELATTAEIIDEDPRILKIIETIQSDSFKKILQDLGGYKTDKTGVIRKIGN